MDLRTIAPILRTDAETLDARTEALGVRVDSLEAIVYAALDGKTEDAKALLAQHDSKYDA